MTQRWPKVKIIIATGYAEMPEEYKGKFERLGKPFTELRIALPMGCNCCARH